MKLASKFKTATVLGAVCAAFAVPAHAEFTGSAGLGVHVWDGGYRDTDAQVWPIPAVDVETDHFYFKPKSRSKRSRYSSENDVLIEKSVKYTDFFLLSIVYV